MKHSSADDSGKKRLRSFETKCVGALLRISYLEHKTYDWVRSKINFLVGPQGHFWQLSRDGNLHGSGMSHVITASRKKKKQMHGTFEGGQCHGRQRKCWMDNIKERTSLPMPELLIMASCRKHWKKISALLSLTSPDDAIGQGTELN